MPAAISGLEHCKDELLKCEHLSIIDNREKLRDQLFLDVPLCGITIGELGGLPFRGEWTAAH